MHPQGTPHGHASFLLKVPVTCFLTHLAPQDLYFLVEVTSHCHEGLSRLRCWGAASLQTDCLLPESMLLVLQIPALKDLFTAILKKALNDDKSQWDQAMQVRLHARLSRSFHSLFMLKCGNTAHCMPAPQQCPLAPLCLKCNSV